MAMIGKVRLMFFREKKSVREIVRLTSLSRNTVRKWLKAAVLAWLARPVGCDDRAKNDLKPIGLLPP